VAARAHPASARDETQVAWCTATTGSTTSVFEPPTPRIVAVLDWELSTLGHPLADFSYHCMSWHIPPGSFAASAGLDHAALGIPSERDYVRRYCERTGRGDPDASWPTGTSTSPTNCSGSPASCRDRQARRSRYGVERAGRPVGRRRPPLAEMGWRIAQQT
jgi:hypothetical protein